jgi:hypothetical protein
VESAISAGISTARTPVEIPAFVLWGAKGDERSSGITCRGADAQKRRIEARALAVGDSQGPGAVPGRVQSRPGRPMAEISSAAARVHSM